MLINRETTTSRPVVFSVPPPDDISAMPTPLTPPDSAQKYPPSDMCLPDHKGALSEEQLTPSSGSDLQMGEFSLRQNVQKPIHVIEITTSPGLPNPIPAQEDL